MKTIFATNYHIISAKSIKFFDVVHLQQIIFLAMYNT